MLVVNKEQLAQVEYLLWQSKQGNHLLFEPSLIRSVFERAGHNPEWSDGLAYEVEHHIERMIEQPTLIQKRAYLERLDQTTLDRVIRTYFNIVENSIFEELEIKH